MSAQEELQICKGSFLGPFEVESLLGEGGFGVVAKCRNIKNNQSVAIKVNKNDQEFLNQAIEEISNLKKLQCLDPDNCNIVKWNGFFIDKNSICLNFELLDQSIYDYMLSRQVYRFLPVTEIRSVLGQMASALSHLSSIGLVHADLKPENIMVVDRHRKPLKVKLIDFGLARPVSSCFAGDWVGTLSYNAPELLMQLPFDETVDMWTLGLTVAEMVCGYRLYLADTAYGVLSYIIQVQGQPDDDLIDQSVNPEYFFTRKDAAPRRWRLKTPEEFEQKLEDRPTINKHFFSSLDDLEVVMYQQRGHHEDHHLLVDLIKKMLSMDPKYRIKPHEVLQHPFMSKRVPQSSHLDTFMMEFDWEKEDSWRSTSLSAENIQPDAWEREKEDSWRSTSLSAENFQAESWENEEEDIWRSTSLPAENFQAESWENEEEDTWRNTSPSAENIQPECWESEEEDSWRSTSQSAEINQPEGWENEEEIRKSTSMNAEGIQLEDHAENESQFGTAIRWIQVIYNFSFCWGG